jgi:RNA polymerase sigma-70 factor, ECF subfamily
MDLKKVENFSDEELAVLVESNKEFFGVLIRRYENSVSGYIYKLNGGTKEVIEDILQNIFIKAYVHINSFRREQKFSNWLYGVAHNECIDYWRKNKKHQTNISLQVDEKLAAKLASGEDLAEDIARQQEEEKFQKALNQLPLKYREILFLRFSEDKSYEDIAHILKKPVSTVGTLVRRAKKNI